MQTHALARLSDGALLRRLARLVAHDRATTAGLLASIAEVDARRLYAPAGYSSMHAYCVGALRLSEDAAAKRIQAARAARRVPALFAALADGRIHLTGVWLLAPHLTPENAEELIAAATHRPKAEIEAMLVRRYLPALELEHAPGHVGIAGRGRSEAEREHAPGHVEGRAIEFASHSSERVSLRLAISRSTQEKLRYAQALLSHAVPSGDPALVLDRALDVLIGQLEKRKFGTGGSPARKPRGSVNAGSRPGPGAAHQPGGSRARQIPAAIRHTVWERDNGRCTFVGAAGHRCESRRFLEFDHVVPVARGGKATVEGLRLRCRTHNQYEAERAFGAGFMGRKRESARRAKGGAIAGRQVEPRVEASESARSDFDEQFRDIEACLRRLGCRGHETRRAIEVAIHCGGETFEARLGAALRSLAPKSARAPS